MPEPAGRSAGRRDLLPRPPRPRPDRESGDVDESDPRQVVTLEELEDLLRRKAAALLRRCSPVDLPVDMGGGEQTNCPDPCRRQHLSLLACVTQLVVDVVEDRVGVEDPELRPTERCPLQKRSPSLGHRLRIIAWVEEVPMMTRRGVPEAFT
jgi:hypothetical protein